MQDLPFDSSRRRFGGLMLASVAAAALPVRAADPEWLPVVPPQATDSPGKIEVLEFFSYGCNHCREFNPMVTAWAARQSKDVVFKKAPVSFGRAAWENLGRLYFALEATGQLERLDNAVFEAIHARKINLFTEDAALGWVRSQGVDAARLKDAWSGFSTETRMSRAEQLSRNYKVDSVPLLVIGGRYKVIGRAGMGYEGKLAVADELIARMRKETGKR